MAGYRESSFDPNAGGDYGRPMRPFNWMQWLGLVIGVVGLVLTVLHFAVEFGSLDREADIGTTLPVAPMFLGSILINSRRASRQKTRKGA